MYKKTHILKSAPLIPYFCLSLDIKSRVPHMLVSHLSFHRLAR